ncbi:MAG TPA: amidase family protein, partial [Iamia sp.]|nr:amidase family protein [Iamia sp.]
MTTDHAFMSAPALAAAIRAKEISSVELLELYLDRIARLNPGINAVVTIDEDAARTRAQEADAALVRGESWGPLHGVPMTLKETFQTAGMRTTAGLEEFAAFVPEVDADVTARLRAAGAVIFGKTNVPEGAIDYQCFNPVFGVTNNPWNEDRTSGGSSGGAAAALAAGFTALEVGSDLGGSIRTPSHSCGVYGLKPTFGIISVHGHLPPPPGA